MTKARKFNPADYRTYTPAQLDEAIMYQAEYGRDLQKLDRLLAARGHKEV